MGRPPIVKVRIAPAVGCYGQSTYRTHNHYDVPGPTECNRRVSVAMKCGLRSQIRIFGDDQHMGDLAAGCHKVVVLTLE